MRNVQEEISHKKNKKNTPEKLSLKKYGKLGGNCHIIHKEIGAVKYSYSSKKGYQFFNYRAH